jgi:membrane associated rhomboid family serine protease
VVAAIGIACGIAEARGTFILIVPAEDAPRARVEIERFARENRERLPAFAPAEPLTVSVAAAAVYAVALMAFDTARRRGAAGLDWYGAGLAKAALIRGGAWWRTVTALFLHGDLLHVAGNLAFGAVFGTMLAQNVGFGAAWLIFVVSGMAGNVINAWAQSPAHASIGASTGIFGMLGALAVHDWITRRAVRSTLVRRWAPLAIGAVLLAWLGGDGKSPADPTFPISFPDRGIDVGAHVFGFLAGCGCGALLGAFRPRAPWGGRIQAALAAAACALVAFSWIAAAAPV